VRWFAHLFGPEDGIPDSFTEARLEIRGNPVLGFEFRFLEWLGDDGVYGCFNID